MKSLFKDVLSELKLVLTGKTLDILLPPVLFLILNNLFNLYLAMIGSLLLSLIFLGNRVYKKERWQYALGGVIGVVIAIVLSYIDNNANNFFLPDIIGTLVLVITTIVSLVIKKPLAIYVSHITRGWDLKWFYLETVKPAYTKVTYFWLLFFIIRLFVELYLYINNSVDQLVLSNIIMGYPLLIAVLTISYIYGITRLRKMKGPGIDEFMNSSKPPYRGQTRGF